MTPPRLILASASAYRRELLARLGVVFASETPEIDERAAAGEPPAVLAHRLAIGKARAVSDRHPDAAVIGSDQVAVCDGVLLGKPGSAEACRQQLRAQAARAVEFHTAVAVLYPAGNFVETFSDLTIARFRPLTTAEIDRYIAAEQPYDCAGGFKSEGLGISLFDSIRSDDPTGLIGLPLIRLSRCLRALGYEVP